MIAREADMGWGFTSMICSEVCCYPARMSDAVSWHHSAKPGQVLLQEHDVHLLHMFVNIKLLVPYVVKNININE